MVDLCQAYDARLSVDELNFQPLDHATWPTQTIRYAIFRGPGTTHGLGHRGRRGNDGCGLDHPLKALEEHQAGRFDLVSVTVKQLSAVAEYENLEALRRRCLTRTPFHTTGRRTICHLKRAIKGSAQ